MEKKETALKDKMNGRKLLMDVLEWTKPCDCCGADNVYHFETANVETLSKTIPKDLKISSGEFTSNSEIKLDIVRELDPVQASVRYPPAPPPPDALDLLHHITK